MDDWCEMSANPLPVGEAVAFVQDARAGGVGVFLGTSRAETAGDGRKLDALDYQAYDDMAARQLADLARRARERWPMVVKVAVLHRTGRVGLGEPSVVVAVSTPHRGESFEACRWLIDTLKVELAVWKREVWAGGTGTWVHPG